MFKQQPPEGELLFGESESGNLSAALLFIHFIVVITFAWQVMAGKLRKNFICWLVLVDLMVLFKLYC